MKNYFILLLTFVFAFSCSSDDDSSDSVDSVVKDWKIVTFIAGGEDIPLDVCTRQYNVSIKEDGTGVINRYTPNEEGVCTKNVEPFTWKFISAGIYELKLNDDERTVDFTLNDGLLQMKFILFGSIQIAILD